MNLGMSTKNSPPILDNKNKHHVKDVRSNTTLSALDNIIPDTKIIDEKKTYSSMQVEMKMENLERLPHIATFTKVDLILSFRPGHEKRGAVIKCFLNAIHNHDQCVHKVEEKWRKVDDLQQVFTKANKVFRNMDAFYYVANSDPLELEQYEELLPRMSNITQRLSRIEDIQVKKEAIREYRQFKKTMHRNQRLVDLRDKLDHLKNERNRLQNELMLAQLDLSRLRVQEEELANKISQDHMTANDRRISLFELFPNVHNGFILTHCNDQYVEHLEYADIMDYITYAPSPHICTFKRYDYVYDICSGEWTPLQRLRNSRVYIQDPLVKYRGMFAAVKNGDVDTVAAELRMGGDPNMSDNSQTSLLHLAATNNHIPSVHLLVQSGADIDPRDLNMSTPLLVSVRKGLTDMVHTLLNLGAEKYVNDRMSRSTGYFAASSGKIDIVKLFINKNNCNSSDNVWGFTPLHIAALRGDEILSRYLLDIDANIYILDKKRRTAEGVALESKFDAIYSLLKEKRFEAPGQLAHSFEHNNRQVNIWIGEHAAVESATWLAQTGFNFIYCIIHEEEELSLVSSQANNNYRELIDFIYLSCDDDDVSDESWLKMSSAISTFVNALSDAVARGGNILICDPTGFSTSVAMLSIFLLLKHQIRIENTEKCCISARPCVYLSLSLRKGLLMLQSRLDNQRAMRYDSRLRSSPIISIAF